MKISAILVTVNLAAIPIAAQAAEQAVSDKAAWITQNLAVIDTGARATARKLSMSDGAARVKRKQPKLRPFVPGRKLPSRVEIELAEQRARMDYSMANAAQLYAQQPCLGIPSQPLAGQISAYAVPPVIVTPPKRTSNSWARANARPASIPKATPRAVPQPIMPAQVAYPPVFPQPVARIPEPPRTPPAFSNFVANKAPAVKQRIVRQAGALLVQAPVLTPDDELMLNQLMELNKPGRSAEFQDLPGSHASTGPVYPTPQHLVFTPQEPGAHAAPSFSAGPPPFPLNLLPKDALQDLVAKQHQRRVPAPPAYFGSWHRPVQMSVPVQSYNNRGQKRVYRRHVSELDSTGRYNYCKRPVISQPEVAVYPPYETSRTSMF